MLLPNVIYNVVNISIQTTSISIKDVYVNPWCDFYMFYSKTSECQILSLKKIISCCSNIMKIEWMTLTNIFLSQKSHITKDVRNNKIEFYKVVNST